MDRAGATTPARAMHVEEDDAVPFANRRSVDAGKRPARGVHGAGRDMTGSDRVWDAGEAPVPQVHIGAADFRTRGPQQRGAARKIGSGKPAQLDWCARRGHHRGEDAVAHAVYVILERMLIQTMSALWLVAALAAPDAPQQPQPYKAPKARRHFISVSMEKQFIQPFAFAKHPLSDLLGRPVDEVHLESFQFRTHDQQTTINALEFGNRGTAFGATVYPFGSSVGATLAIRGSIETVPTIRLAFTGPAPAATYLLTNGLATDIGAGIDMSDRAPGWGLGAHAFVIGGIGRVETDQLIGRRYFLEGGGGVMSGPFGVDIAFKFNVNRFTTPVTHTIYMIPISVRGTLSF
jgi:hypothetical protein